MCSVSVRFCWPRLLFFYVGLAHDDRRRGRAETRRHALDPLRGCGRKPAAAVAAIGAGEFVGGADDADVAAARSVAVDWPIELYLEADNAHDFTSAISTLRYCLIVRVPTRIRLSRAALAIGSGLCSTRASSVLAPFNPVVTITNTSFPRYWGLRSPLRLASDRRRGYARRSRTLRSQVSPAQSRSRGRCGRHRRTTAARGASSRP